MVATRLTIGGTFPDRAAKLMMDHFFAYFGQRGKTNVTTAFFVTSSPKPNPCLEDLFGPRAQTPWSASTSTTYVYYQSSWISSFLEKKQKH
jgi:hypothetical protein